jgi:hypothetical protein
MKVIDMQSESYKEKLKNLKEVLTLDDIAQKKFNKNFDELNTDEKKEVNYVYSEWTDDYEEKYPFHMKINHLSFAMPYQIEGSPVSTTFAIGYRTYYDMGYNYFWESSENDSDEGTTINNHGGLNTLTFGGGIGYLDKFYGGIAINIGILGDTSSEYEETNYGDDYESEGSIKGSFITLGATYNATPKLSFGFTYRPGFDVEIEDEYDDYDYYYDKSNTEKYDITVPGLFAVSSSYKMSDAFKFIVEYQKELQRLCLLILIFIIICIL